MYFETLRRLCRSIKSKQPGLLTEGVITLHDKTRRHISKVTKGVLVKFKWKQLEHPQPKGNHFDSDDELQHTVKDWLLPQPQEAWEPETPSARESVE